MARALLLQNPVIIILFPSLYHAWMPVTVEDVDPLQVADNLLSWVTIAVGYLVQVLDQPDVTVRLFRIARFLQALDSDLAFYRVG